MIEFEDTLLQSDYSVGFERFAFTWEQLDKLKSFVSEFEFKFIIYFMITTRMYFLFFTCEMKCGVVVFDVVDRQNAQSMSVVLRIFVVLFRSVKREKELNQKILAFFVSHDHRSMKIYDHYSVIEGIKIIFYRHLIRAFDFTNGEESEQLTNSSRMCTMFECRNYIKKSVRPLMTCQSISVLIFFNLLLSPKLHLRVRSNQTPNLY